MRNTRTGNSVRNMIFGIIKYGISTLLPFVIRTVLILRIGSEYAGVSSLFSSILQVLNLSELGFSNAVVFALYKPIANNDNEKICAILKLFRKVYSICGAVILCAGLIVSPFLKHLIKGSYPSDINIYIVYIIILLNTAFSYLFFGYKSVLFVAHQRNDITSKIQIISYLVTFSMELVALTFFESYYLYTFSVFTGTVLSNILYHFFSKKMYPTLFPKGHLDKLEKNNIYKNVGALFGHQLDTVIINSADNIVISSFLGLRTLTIYNNYYFIMNSILSVMIMISNSVLASIGDSIAVESKEKNYRDFISLTYIFGVITIWASIMLIVLYKDFMLLWMGPNMLLDFSTMLLIVINFYTRQFRRAVSTYKNAAGLWQLDKWKPYIASATNLVVNIILVKNIGINGVLISTILTFAVIEIPWETWAVFKGYFNCNAKEYLLTQVNLLIKFVVCGLFAYYICDKFHPNSILVFFIKLVCAGVLIVFSISLISLKDKEFGKTVNRFKNVFFQICKKG